MNLLTAENISKSYSEKILLENICLGINEGDKIGIIGVNGTGKSTLLKILFGFEVPDSGSITKANKCDLGYLPQNCDFSGSDATVLEQIFRGNSPIMKLLRKYRTALSLIKKDPDNTDLQNILFDLNSKMESKNAWEIENKAKTILTKLGIVDFDAKISTLSGGQKKRIALASTLITPSNMLILDEPTNHLDDETIEWLEDFLNKFNGALVMVTHDRFFLDKITNRIFELSHGNLYSYTGNYSTFLEKKAERLERENADDRKRKSLIKKELAWIRRGAKARSTKQKARIERFENLTGEEHVAADPKLDIDIKSSRIGKKVINIDNISKSFGDKIIVKNFSYNILNNDRIGIIGPNGCGKSTLMNILCKRISPDSGSIDIGETIKIGYFSQEISGMDMNQRVIEYIKNTSGHTDTESGEKISASAVLEKFLFEPSVQWTPLRKLSGGERRRLYLLKVLMEYPNLLLLDEPTNDLDIETLTILEDYLQNFTGAVVAVSHDRYFLDKIVNKLFVFEGHGRISQYTSSYSYFRRMQREKQNEISSETIKENKTKKIYTRNREKKLKFTYKEQLEFNEIDGIIENLENAISKKEREMEEASSDYILLEKLTAEKETLKKELDKKIDRWTYLNELNEKIQENKKQGV
ncbi:ABC-F family ATP-binding cassette domain-containing protein [Clostridium luticellarii]|jgi:ATP-binding cassette subfamily F protein uup|uniref:Putative ABC transporter ATP-binding protein YjjK n=1 Tax=Clostridium luticellarii TaxID=1691940 RepID=A0A2T0BEY2_9CLOT|nr:ABC-F family ATP-binding cassette domain-containing protein [Clostridium luticellarii]MCI1996068.1 ABC-F family ATP-binding cassette domain-containing protein [Clostridium luticellarii]PRR82460.1 putative ABC transporter ATP-binding protein YjjK [Clostridium luticellarii]